MENPPRPTLLVFTLGPGGESARRRLLPPGARRLEGDLHQACLDGAVAAGRRCDLAVEVSSPAPLALPAGIRRVDQQGEGFGERLADAVRGALSRGAGPLLVVGTDVPGLTAGHLRQALERLAADPGRVVLGPSPDGGLYLLAASRPLDHLLAGLPWCRPDSLTRLEAALAGAGFTVERLEPLADLDRPADLERWLAGRPGLRLPRWQRFLVTLQELLAAWRRPLIPRRLGRLRPALLPVRRGRAPPARLPR